MIVFGALLSPYVRKVCVALAEKGVDYELKLSRPRNPDPDFLAASPFGKIPAMKHGDYTLADSSAIVAYVDAVWPEPALIPADPKLRGRAIWFDEFSDTILAGSGLKVLFNRYVAPVVFKKEGNEAVAQKGMEELPPIWAYLESQVPEQGWLVDAFSIADLSIASMIRSLEHVDAQPCATLYPRTAAWYQRVCARPSWIQVAAEDSAKG
ncbi:glutathione S-transferase family protein [Novosphingobium sp. FSY-8]|uniref:Glutathione S-transferase family protein n=1 Tax=Novosphingobium ovatum TaxID=1908523 RepID=A0ABW9XAW7_9SPHN|nr:glutathione S-transferase family protein [Novosphingobium ovatum]NBC35674.1 glutathione S-transferase family protein [Novosphingobium ovatum]